MILNINSAELHTGATLVAMLISKVFKLDFESDTENVNESSYDKVDDAYCAVYAYSGIKDVKVLEEGMTQIQNLCSKLLGGTKVDPRKSFGWTRKPKWSFKNAVPINFKFKCSRWEQLQSLELEEDAWNAYLNEFGLTADTALDEDDSDY